MKIQYTLPLASAGNVSPFLFCVGLHAIAFSQVTTVKIWGVNIIFSHHFVFSCVVKQTFSFFGWLEEHCYAVKLKKTNKKKKNSSNFLSELDQGEKIMTEF